MVKKADIENDKKNVSAIVLVIRMVEVSMIFLRVEDFEVKIIEVKKLKAYFLKVFL